MKKHLVLGALAVLALAACTKSEVVELNKGNEISLTAVTGKNLTKAQDGYCNNAKPGDFYVWAATGGNKYFEEQKYYLPSGETTYKADGAARYWPASAVDFFALKNYNGTVSFDATTPKITVTGYTVESTPATQKDFLYAVDKGVSKPDGGAAAPLNFRHALSQIEFKAANANTNIHVVIDELKVVNVFSKGDFSVSDETTTPFEEHDLTDTDTPDPRIGVCSWDNQSTTATYVITPKDLDGNNISVDVKNGGNANLTVTDPTGQEYNENTLYILPQTVDRWIGSGSATSSSKAYFLIKALIYNVAGTEVNKSTDVVLWGDHTSGSWVSKYIAVPIPESTTWVGGLRYVYTFNFTSYGTGGVDPGTGDPVLTPIKLTVTVDDFVDAGNTDVDVK